MTGSRSTRAAAAAGGRGRLGLLACATVAGVVALVVLAVLAGSPGSSSDLRERTPGPATSASAGSIAPDPDVNLSDAEQVCAAFAAALFTVTDGDDWPRGAYRRASAYTTTELAAALVADQGRLPVPQQRPAPGGVDVAAYVGDHMRPDTDAMAYRAVLVTVTNRGGTAARHVVYCTLHRVDARWLVAGYEGERSLP